MQDLGQIGAHARPLARRQDDDRKTHYPMVADKAISN
jgi:hypothetical protein